AIVTLTTLTANSLLDHWGTLFDGGDLRVYGAATAVTITAASWSGGVVTITAANHGLVSGDQAIVLGMTPTAYNGRYVVTFVDVNNFTYVLAADPGTATVFGTSALTVPANGDTAFTGTLLATLTAGSPAVSAAVSRVMSLAAITQDSSAEATEQAVAAEIRNSGATVQWRCDVGKTGDGTTIELDDDAIVSGVPVQITTFTLNL
ncbi:MAG: hypothetical protein KAJ03_04430, partial [Gammaproteobacteria bacterium]|nr:hypothetical protein [Gammaproteobacteria bacterium]